MTKIAAGSAATCDADMVAVEIAEAEFIVAVQSEIQRVMNGKGLRARDLSKRLNVSEARISQMFGDQAKNLTIRTIAKLFYHLGENPVITTQCQLERMVALSSGDGSINQQQWTVSGLVNDIQIGSNMVVTRDDTDVASPDRGRLVNRWAQAEEADTRRPRRLAVAG
jgi:DNA-binding Xre family transcriptional regulator